jgi:SAM-dependent methyltransferase
MSVLDWLLGKRFREPQGDSTQLTTLGLSGGASPERLSGATSPERREPLRALERLTQDRSWLFPPEDMHDAGAWDRFWNEQIAHGLPPQIFDMFSDDRVLIAYMKKRGFGSVLCAGNGISQEPRALAAAGFAVTALDISPVAARLVQAIEPTPDYLGRFVDATSHRSGGSVDYVTADLLDAAACPGPFDVIIERRTVQLFRGQEFNNALEALTRRLRSDGLFFRHCHDGRWRPPAPRVHAAEAWFREHSWTIWRDELDAAPPERLVSLFVSTG